VNIQFYIIRTSEGLNGIDPVDLELAMLDLNEIYKNTDVQFVICSEPIYIDDDYYAELVIQENYSNLKLNYFVDDAINIYCTSFLRSSIFPICGVASHPSQIGRKTIAMSNSCVNNGSTFSHEMGHFYGLVHTHETTDGDEYVNGSNCQQAGDLLCDTPADPRLSTSNVSEYCVYTGDDKDPLGDDYAPDPLNLMSYSRKECRTKLSDEQIALINHHHHTSNAKYISNCTISDFKIFSSSIVPEGIVEVYPQDIQHLNFRIENLLGELEEPNKFTLNFHLIKPQGERDLIQSKTISTSQLPLSDGFAYEIPADLPYGNYQIIGSIGLPSNIKDINTSNNIYRWFYEVRTPSKSDQFVSFDVESNRLLIFNTSINDQSIDVAVFDASGRLVYSNDLPIYNENFLAQIHLHNLSNGIYLVRLGKGKKTIASHKFLVVR
jgi:hypothetical protein